MRKKDCEKRIALLERILKYLTGAREIRYRDFKYVRESDYGYISLVNVQPDKITPHGIDEGLHLDWGSEYYEDKKLKKILGVHGDKIQTRIIAEIWYDVDPYAKIEKLEKELDTLVKLCKQKNFNPLE